ncbi:DUF6415 family natural product biosynthesis protein [Streptomyces sp. E11-3]|uniref:DUF6415 family natural product biosynthesis protein n=1 Tax=Streptomyces sp. E11-3 TaxID=3110112 RepID=UPI00397EEDBB
MATAAPETAAELSGRYSTDDATANVLLSGLRRALAHEAVTEDLYADLDAVLDEYAHPAPDEVRVIAERLRTAAIELVKVVPYIVKPYPADQIRCLTNLSAEQPRPADERGHLVRLASALLTLLDMMGAAAA